MMYLEDTQNAMKNSQYDNGRKNSQTFCPRNLSLCLFCSLSIVFSQWTMSNTSSTITFSSLCCIIYGTVAFDLCVSCLANMITVYTKFRNVVKFWTVHVPDVRGKVSCLLLYEIQKILTLHSKHFGSCKFASMVLYCFRQTFITAFSFITVGCILVMFTCEVCNKSQQTVVLANGSIV